MKRGFRNLFEVVRREVKAGSSACFREAQLRHPCLAHYPNLPSVLTAMGEGEADDWPRKEELTRALIVEYQETQLPFWGAVLLVAYYPMLQRLRGRIGDSSLDFDDLDQIVIASFLKVVATFPTAKNTDFMVLGLRQRTQRQVFAALKRERMEWKIKNKATALDQGTPWDEFIEEQQLCELEDPYKTIESLIGISWRKLSSKNRWVIFAAVIHNEQLRAYVNRIIDESDCRELVYQRLKRRRSRAFGALRKLLVWPSPGKENQASGDER